MSAARDNRILPLLALVLGVVLVIGGLFGVGLYIAGVIDIIIDQPADRSLIFWGLGVAFFGATLLVAGAVLIVVWRKSRSNGD